MLTGCHLAYTGASAFPGLLFNDVASVTTHSYQQPSKGNLALSIPTALLISHSWRVSGQQEYSIQMKLENSEFLKDIWYYVFFFFSSTWFGPRSSHCKCYATDIYIYILSPFCKGNFYFEVGSHQVTQSLELCMSLEFSILLLQPPRGADNTSLYTTPGYALFNFSFFWDRFLFK